MAKPSFFWFTISDSDNTSEILYLVSDFPGDPGDPGDMMTSLNACS